MGWSIRFHSNFQSVIYANDFLEEEDVNKHSAKVGIKRFSTACLFRLKIQNTEPSIHWVEFTNYMKTTHSFQRHNTRANEWVNEWASSRAHERYKQCGVSKCVSNFISFLLKVWKNNLFKGFSFGNHSSEIRLSFHGSHDHGLLGCFRKKINWDVSNAWLAIGATWGVIVMGGVHCCQGAAF